MDALAETLSLALSRNLAAQAATPDLADSIDTRA
jgi:hypothetical protein